METKADISELAWDIIWDMINLGLIPKDVKTEDLDMAHKWILERFKRL